jgi:tetratricopeptide (TPR) repeat protein
VLGVAYYRHDRYSLAFNAFQQAAKIFEPLDKRDWLGQIYAWRGTLYRDQQEWGEAKNDLQKSLDIGASNIRPMTLYWMGRVYTALRDWEQAETYMQESLREAQQVPDFQYWLASIARLIAIAAEKGEYARLDEFKRLLASCLWKHKSPEKNSLGMAYVGLARLALGQNAPTQFVCYMRRGIARINSSSYSHADILGQLEFVENGFKHINSEIIRDVGQRLQTHVVEKELEDIDYSAVTPIMYRWATWKGDSHAT